MTIDDLKTGMVVELRNGRMYVVMRDTYFDGEQKDVFWREGGFWMPLSDYAENLKNIPNQQPFVWNESGTITEEDFRFASLYDIVAVYRPSGPGTILAKHAAGNKILWTEEDGDLDMSLFEYQLVKRDRGAEN